MTTRLRTGIDVLDRKLDGGIPPGRIVVLSAAPTSQSELFLYEIASIRETVYLTTERTTADVTACLEHAGNGHDSDVDVRRIDSTDPLAAAEEAMQNLTEGSNLVIDPTMLLERAPPDQYRAFLNDLRARAKETKSIALLHCLEGGSPPERRVLTEYMADVVLDLVTEDTGDTIENRLTVPKFRGGHALEDAIKLDLTAGVTIDVSRKIV